MNNREQFYVNVLSKLKEGFDALDMAVILRGPEDGAPVHMLNVLHTELSFEEEEVMGEYYFVPLDDQQSQFHMFTSMLSLTESMPDDKYDILGKAANLLNFYVPAGAFVFSKPEHIIAFKHTSLIPINATEDEAIKLIDGNMSLSLKVVGRYLDVFMKLMKGKLDFDDFMATLPMSYWR